jgi:hypothetical protein
VRIALRLLAVIAVFGLSLGTLYWFLTYEWVGAVLLWFLGLMPLIVGVWWSRRGATAEVVVSDDPDAEPAQAAGHRVGSFPMATAWPIFLVLGVIVTGASLVYGLILLPAGVGLLLWSVVGLARESRG